MKVYLVYSNDCYEGDCDCGASHRTLEDIFLDKEKALIAVGEHYKGYFEEREVSE